MKKSFYIGLIMGAASSVALLNNKNVKKTIKQFK